MKGRLLERILAVALSTLVGLPLGCGSNEPLEPQCKDAECLTEDGWSLFEASDYDSAVARFEVALGKDVEYGEAYNGLGWAYLAIDSLGKAAALLDTALAKGVTSADPFGGQAVCYRDLEMETFHFEEAVAACDSALSRSPRYVFVHDSTFTWKDLHLIAAQSLFALQEYSEANTRIDSLGGAVQDSTDAEFVEKLLAEIERLGDEICGEKKAAGGRIREGTRWKEP